MKPTLRIVKIGGNVINDASLLKKVVKDFAALSGQKILVHGGGKLLEELAVATGHRQQMINGRRITDAKTLEMAVMVYAGAINKKIVSQLQAANCNAIGLCGADLKLITTVKRAVSTIDYGYVGDVQKNSVNTEQLNNLLNMGAVPIFSAITANDQGQVLNTNADTIAAALATAMAPFFETHLHYCFEKNGVLSDVSDHQSVIPKVDAKLRDELYQQGKIHTGMLPKIDMALAAAQGGAHKVFIQSAEALATAEFTSSGTLVYV